MTQHIVSFLLDTLSCILYIIFSPVRIVLSFFGYSFDEKKSPAPEKQDLIKMSIEGDIVNMNYDNLTEEDQEKFRKALVEEMDFPRYEGEVAHAYELTYVKDSKTCPRCQSETEQCYANFIYATQVAPRVAPRVMFVLAGFFCTKCPTVVIDHKTIQQGTDKKFQFRGAVGVDYGTKKEPDFFQTWNGKQATYIFDEDQNFLGLSTSPVKSNSHRLKKRANPKRKKIARQSRRKNRGKKK
jgi:hypothetical protein